MLLKILFLQKSVKVDETLVIKNHVPIIIIIIMSVESFVCLDLFIL
jgi:hypothetical protein